MRRELPTGNLHTYCIIPDKSLRASCKDDNGMNIKDPIVTRVTLGFVEKVIINEDRQAENDQVDGIAIEQEIVVVLVQLEWR